MTLWNEPTRNNCFNLPANPEGPPPPEVEQRAMWQWIRDFHKDLDWFGWFGLFSLISILGSQDMSRGLFDNTVYICIRMYTVCVYIYMLSYIKIQWDSWSTEAVDKLWRWTLQVKSLALPGVQWRLVHSEHATLARPIQANLRAGDEENAWSRSGFEADVRCITVSFNSFNVFECSLFFQAQLKWLQYLNLVT